MHQGGRKKYECVSKMSEKSMLETEQNYCLIRRREVRKTLGKYVILVAYCRDNCVRLQSKLGSCASVFTGQVLNAPRQSIRL